MSIHPSLRPRSKGSVKRCVLTRYERIIRLMEEGRWEPEKNSPFGLPKIRVYVAKKRRKGGGKKK